MPIAGPLPGWLQMCPQPASCPCSTPVGGPPNPPFSDPVVALRHTLGPEPRKRHNNQGFCTYWLSAWLAVDLHFHLAPPLRGHLSSALTMPTMDLPMH